MRALLLMLAPLALLAQAHAVLGPGGVPRMGWALVVFALPEGTR